MATPRTKAAAAARAAPEPVREEARSPAREEVRVPEGRVAARRRDGTVVWRHNMSSDGTNKWFIPPEMIPPGWDWQWKRFKVVDKEDPAYMADLYNAGFEPVMAEAYPGTFLPVDKKGPIVIDGLMLMERDMALTIEARNEEKRNARERLQVSRRQRGLNAAGAHGVATDTAAVRANSYVRVEREPVAGANTDYAQHRKPLPVD